MARSVAVSRSSDRLLDELAAGGPKPADGSPEGKDDVRRHLFQVREAGGEKPLGRLSPDLEVERGGRVVIESSGGEW